ncbi:hypothetical protein BT67DRAFT_51298 [Trichocladium antarcticum]|uniref:Uncharacterized protein n=1 Tax=Trichocladium antarcticum TaxID=1450529 RepID=A0AAN6UID1_9PEZI|nr:hypothetical protein BT67DRAFT_51298 [Trichocladium antarcticum]
MMKSLAGKVVMKRTTPESYDTVPTVNDSLTLCQSSAPTSTKPLFCCLPLRLLCHVEILEPKLSVKERFLLVFVLAGTLQHINRKRRFNAMEAMCCCESHEWNAERQTLPLEASSKVEVQVEGEDRPALAMTLGLVRKGGLACSVGKGECENCRRMIRGCNLGTKKILLESRAS